MENWPAMMTMNFSKDQTSLKRRGTMFNSRIILGGLSTQDWPRKLI